MIKKKIATLCLLATVFGLFSVTGFAETDTASAVLDVAGSESLSDLNVVVVDKAVDKTDSTGKVVRSTEEQVGMQDVCGFDVPEQSVYSAKIIAVRRQLRVEPGETFRVKVFMKNTGNMPWFANKSTCLGPKMSLGTDLERDRDSQFYQKDLEGWEGANRVAIDGYRADPGEIASFTFWLKASDTPDVYKEYFTPVLKDLQWIDDARFSFEVIVGDSDDTAGDIRKKLEYSNVSGSVGDLDLNAERSIEVDLSDQTLKVKLGETLVREFRVSTGAAATPTPVGETRIILKQPVRVGNKPPHYIMPRFMMFREGGYGFHALPSLGTDGGVFWTEARNHIGIPVSHGCIRVLPEDADWLYDFTDVGTKVVVHR